MTTAYDYSPLRRPAGVGARWRELRQHPLLVMGAVIGLVMIATAVSVLGVQAGRGTATDDGGLLACLVMLGGGGIALLVSLYVQLGASGSLDAFARANDLVRVPNGAATDYGAGVFATGHSIVHRAVRTREDGFVEVGERFPVGGSATSHDPRTTEVYLRVRLSGRARAGASAHGVVDDALDRDLRAWAGPFQVELSSDEVTVLGSRTWRLRRPGRVRDGLELAERLRTRAEAVLQPVPLSHGPEVAASGITIPRPAPAPARGRARSVLATVAATLGLLVVGPFVVAIPLSLLDDATGPWAASLVVGLVVTAVGGVVGALVRLLVRPRSGGRGGDAAAG